MNRIEVQKQVSLPISKCIELVLSGIRFRLFRAGITVVIISLAAAFLMTMLTESFSSRHIGEGISAELAPRKNFLFWASRISTPLDETKLLAELAAINPAGPRWSEFKKWASLTDDQLTGQHELAGDAKQYLRFFAELDEGHYRLTVGRASGVGIFDYLHPPKNWSAFETAVKKTSQKFPTELTVFKRFITDWQATADLREQIIAGHAKAIASLATHLQETPAKLILAEPSEVFLRDLTRAGFQLTPDQLAGLKETAMESAVAERLTSVLGVTVIRSKLARLNNTTLRNADEKVFFKTIKNRSGARWLIETVDSFRQTIVQARSKQARGESLTDEEKTILLTAGPIDGFDYDADSIARIGNQLHKDTRLRDIEASIIASGSVRQSGLLGFGPRTQWLILVSLGVCVVGIANAMLMSVTERFSEIATMKCLGATDGFIMLNFILESILQGLAGGLIGTGLGLALGITRSWASYGVSAFKYMPGGSLAAAAGISFVISLLVSAMASVYPARIAAKLAPMEAMRIE